MKASKYRLFLYKLFTVPNTEGIQWSVFNAFLGMIMLQSANLASILIAISAFYPLKDLKEGNKFTFGIIAFLPPLILNYYIIYHDNGYKKILKEYSSVKKGSLKYIALYFFITVVMMFASVYLFQEYRQ